MLAKVDCFAVVKLPTTNAFTTALLTVAAVASLLNCSVKLSGVFMFSGGAWLTPKHYYLLLSLLLFPFLKVSNKA